MARAGGRGGGIDGYLIDTGPTVLTMPDSSMRPSPPSAKPLSQRLDLLPVDPAYRATFADGDRIDVHSDADRMAAAVREFAGPREAAGYRRCASGCTGCTGPSSTVSSARTSTPLVNADPATGSPRRHRRVPQVGDDG